MAKVQIKSEKITPFGGIFHVREQFSRFVGPVIDKVMQELSPGMSKGNDDIEIVVFYFTFYLSFTFLSN